MPYKNRADLIAYQKAHPEKVKEWNHASYLRRLSKKGKCAKCGNPCTLTAKLCASCQRAPIFTPNSYGLPIGSKAEINREYTKRFVRQKSNYKGAVWCESCGRYGYLTEFTYINESSGTQRTYQRVSHSHLKDPPSMCYLGRIA